MKESSPHSWHQLAVNEVSVDRINKKDEAENN